MWLRVYIAILLLGAMPLVWVTRRVYRVIGQKTLEKWNYWYCGIFGIIFALSAISDPEIKTITIISALAITVLTTSYALRAADALEHPDWMIYRAEKRSLKERHTSTQDKKNY